MTGSRSSQALRWAGRPSREAARHSGEQELREAALAVATAREYLTHVTGWLAGRTSFGVRLIDHPVLRQRLTWAIIAIDAADAALRQPGTSPGDRCATAVNSAASCVRVCEELHAGAGVFDGRPGAVYRIQLRGIRTVPSVLAQASPPLARTRPQLAGRVKAALRAAASTSPGELTTADVRRLVREVEQACPAASAAAVDEVVVAETLAQSLPPGITARLLTHRQVVRSYTTGPDAAPAAAQLRQQAADGRTLVAIAVTEPQAGSDLAGLTTAIHTDCPNLVLHGVKTYVTGAADCDLVLVAAKFETRIALAWVDARPAGVRRRPLPSAAWRGAGFAELEFKSCPLTERDLHRGDGAAVLSAGLAWERLVVAGQQLGYARRWVNELPRSLRGGFVNRLSVVQSVLQMAVANCDPGPLPMVDASMAKVACCAVAADIAEARATALASSHDGRPIEELIGDQASARAATFAGGTADLNLAIVEGKILSFLNGGNGGRK